METDLELVAGFTPPGGQGNLCAQSKKTRPVKRIYSAGAFFGAFQGSEVNLGLEMERASLKHRGRCSPSRFFKLLDLMVPGGAPLSRHRQTVAQGRYLQPVNILIRPSNFERVKLYFSHYFKSPFNEELNTMGL